MSRRPKMLDYNHGIEYLDTEVAGVYSKQRDYSTVEVKDILDCSYETIRSLIRKGHFIAIRSRKGRKKTTHKEGNYRITHESLINFLKMRNNGIRRDIEEILYEGLTSPHEIAQHLNCTTMNVDDMIRLKNIPRFNISASSYPDRKPYYRLPKRETREALEILKR